MLKCHFLPNSTHSKPCFTKMHHKAIFGQSFALNVEKNDKKMLILLEKTNILTLQGTRSS